MLEKGDSLGPLGQLHLDELRRDHPGWSTTHCQEWGLFLLECLLHNSATMWQKERERTTQRYPKAQPSELAKEMAYAHPSVRMLLGSTDREILDLAEQVYQGEYGLAPSELPCLQWEECMMELRQELSQHMTRVGLREGLAPARPTSHSQRCSHCCLSSQTQSPSAGPWGAEAAKQPREGTESVRTSSCGSISGCGKCI